MATGARLLSIIGALVLAAIAVVGILLWLTGSIEFEPEATPTPIAIEPTETPTAPPSNARITPIAAQTTIDAEQTPAVSGVTANAETGPAEYALSAAILAALLGFGGSLMLAKFA